MKDFERDVLEIFANRRSTVSYSDRIPERKLIGAILKAASLAPSAMHEQPWRFIVASKENRADYDRMFGTVAEGNQSWARYAPVLILMAAKKRFDHNGEVNPFAAHDCGMALQNMLLQASECGLAMHVIGAFSRGDVQRLYKIPEEFEPLTITAVGYPGNPGDLPEDLREREEKSKTKVRKQIDEMVFEGEWGKKLF
jgi:nitroreductase